MTKKKNISLLLKKMKKVTFLLKCSFSIAFDTFLAYFFEFAVFAFFYSLGSRKMLNGLKLVIAD